MGVLTDAKERVAFSALSSWLKGDLLGARDQIKKLSRLQLVWLICEGPLECLARDEAWLQGFFSDAGKNRDFIRFMQLTLEGLYDWCETNEEFGK